MIQESREDYKALLEMKRMARPEPELLLENCRMYMLTPRECEVTQLVCEGEKYKDIAEKLFISERTVTKHVQNIFRKTEVTSKIELLNKLGEKAKLKDAAS
jgi:DNA-binding NarL/FixJ family response regulator